jgi:hypothetical protein
MSRRGVGPFVDMIRLRVSKPGSPRAAFLRKPNTLKVGFAVRADFFESGVEGKVFSLHWAAGTPNTGTPLDHPSRTSTRPVGRHAHPGPSQVTTPAEAPKGPASTAARVLKPPTRQARPGGLTWRLTCNDGETAPRKRGLLRPRAPLPRDNPEAEPPSPPFRPLVSRSQTGLLGPLGSACGGHRQGLGQPPQGVCSSPSRPDTLPTVPGALGLGRG